MTLRLLDRRGVAFFAALALLCAQAMGLAHAVAHRHAQGLAVAGLLHAECEEHEHGHGLFDAHHDEGSLQCLLLDQLSHADALAAPPAVAWAFAAPEAACAPAPAPVLHATCARGYHARGPPLFLA